MTRARSVRLKELLHRALLAALSASTLGAGLKLMALLLRARALGAFLVLPFWPNVMDATILIIAGVIGLAEIAVGVWRRWLRRERGTGSA